MRGPKLCVALLIGAVSAHSSVGSASPSSESESHFAPAIFQNVLLSENNSTAVAIKAGDSSGAAKTTPAPGLELMARQMGNCAVGYNTCSTNAAACCGTASYCSNDRNGNLACCKSGATCTGTANYVAASGIVSTITSTSAGVLVLITTTLAVTSLPAAVTNTNTVISYISGALFPFPIYGTSFANSAACTSAYSACTSNFFVCTSQLQGSIGTGFAVTVNDGNGGGITVGAATTTLAPNAASSVCASLAGQACPGTSGTCSVFGTAGGSFIVGSTSVGGGMPRATAGVGGAVLGAGAVVAGWVL